VWRPTKRRDYYTVAHGVQRESLLFRFLAIKGETERERRRRAQTRTVHLHKVVNQLAESAMGICELLTL
jgi:hypothetical protein